MYVFLLIDTMVLKIVIYFVKSLAQRKMGKNEFTRGNESLQTDFAVCCFTSELQTSR